MRLGINLASRPYQNLRPFYTGIGLAGALLLALAVAVAASDLQSRSQNRSLSEQRSQLETERAGLRQEQQDLEQKLDTPEARAIRERSAFLNSLILRKSLSWTRIFMDLERVLPQKAQIVAIRPSLNAAQEAELNLTVAAASMAPLVQFLKNLESSAQFGSPVVGTQRFPSERAVEELFSLEVTTRYLQSLDSSPAPAAGKEASTSSGSAPAPAKEGG